MIKKEKRLEYYKALDKAHTTGKTEDFIKLSAECLEESLNLYLNTIKQADNTKKPDSRRNVKKQNITKEKREAPSHLINLYKKWRSVQPLPEDNYQALWQWIRLQFNHHSNRFEGIPLFMMKHSFCLFTDGRWEIIKSGSMKK